MKTVRKERYYLTAILIAVSILYLAQNNICDSQLLAIRQAVAATQSPAEKALSTALKSGKPTFVWFHADY